MQVNYIDQEIDQLAEAEAATELAQLAMADGYLLVQRQADKSPVGLLLQIIQLGGAIFAIAKLSIFKAFQQFKPAAYGMGKEFA